VINFLYIFTLIILFDQVGQFFDYLILFLVINFIVIKSISYKKSNFKDLILIIFSSVFIDFIAFNYLFSFYLLMFIPFIILNRVIDSFTLSKKHISLISTILSFLIFLIVENTFYLNLSFVYIIILIVIILLSNLILLRPNEFKF
jgi:hypothetical protein